VPDPSSSTKLGRGSATGTLQIVELPHNIQRRQTLSTKDIMSLLKSRPAWLMLAIASGGCAAINGVFAKLYCLCFHLVSFRMLTDCTAQPRSSQRHGQAP
jgi:hypothetical protein